MSAPDLFAGMCEPQRLTPHLADTYARVHGGLARRGELLATMDS
jgi:hypothetical protein